MPLLPIKFGTSPGGEPIEAAWSHNLDAFYKSLTCDDLPLKGDTNVAACLLAVALA